jgi:hypothetical protein
MSFFEEITLVFSYSLKIRITSIIGILLPPLFGFLIFHAVYKLDETFQRTFGTQGIDIPTDMVLWTYSISYLI